MRTRLFGYALTTSANFSQIILTNHSQLFKTFGKIMQLDGNVLVFMRLEGESPVTVLQESETSTVRVVAVSSSSSIAEAVKSNFVEKVEFDGVVAFSDDANTLAAEVNAVVPLVKEGGSLHFYVADLDEDNKSAVVMALMIGGFVDTVVDAEVLGYPGFPTARLFTSRKPSSQAAAIPLKSSATVSQSLKRWTVKPDEFNDNDDEEIIDEDSLLDDTVESLKASKDDCDVGKDGKRRACKDCTCGRKDGENKVVSDTDLAEMVSGCGNCYKGDAFRCGGCPFLGKPAFKPGMEKVLLNLDDADDI